MHAQGLLVPLEVDRIFEPGHSTLAVKQRLWLACCLKAKGTHVSTPNGGVQLDGVESVCRI